MKKNTTHNKKNVKTTTLKEQNIITIEVILINLMIVSLLLFLSIYFNQLGSVGKVMNRFLFGFIGIAAYFLPIYLLIGSFIKIFNIGNRRINHKLLIIISTFLTISTFAHIVQMSEPKINIQTTGGKSGFFNALTEFYEFSQANHRLGGVFGGLFGDTFFILFGKVGSILICIGILLGLFVVFTEISLLDVLRYHGPKIGKRVIELANHLKELVGELFENLLTPRPKKDVFDKIEKMEAVEQIKELDKPNQKTKVVKENYLEKSTIPTKPGKHNQMEYVTEPTITHHLNESTEHQGSHGDKIEDDKIETEFVKVEQPLDMAAKVNKVLKDKVERPFFREGNSEKSVSGTVIKASEETLNELKLAQELKKKYQYPPITLLNQNPIKQQVNQTGLIQQKTKKLEETLLSFGVEAKVNHVSVGPTVTRFELQPKSGVKVSKIVNLSDDIALNLAAPAIRIEAPIPGKAAIGIEVPNEQTSAVYLREVIDTQEFNKFPSDVAFALGKDISGKAIVTDVSRMPHLLIAGATGSGKSVCINTLITSMIYKSSPDKVKLILIDPKVVELSVYNGIPHLLIPVVTNPKRASAALNWAVQEMNDRYHRFADANVRDMKGYNASIAEKGETVFLPHIVIIVDELADLMMVAPGEVEDAICRLAQMARAAGIHLIIATQRPSVDVITGVIKANIPSRIAFSVSSGIDSRTILDSVGAEKLLGKGDMLFSPIGSNKPTRIQGAFITDKEVESIVDFLKNSQKAHYNEQLIQQLTQTAEGTKDESANESEVDVLFSEALEFIIEKEKASSSFLQRKFKIGYNRAARIIDQLHEAGYVGPEEGSKPRKVLMSREQYFRMKEDASNNTNNQE